MDNFVVMVRFDEETDQKSLLMKKIKYSQSRNNYSLEYLNYKQMGKEIKVQNLKIYLDNCCFNRPYDDQRQLKIELETKGKLFMQNVITLFLQIYEY